MKITQTNLPLITVFLLLFSVNTASAYRISIVTHQDFEPFEQARQGFIGLLAQIGYLEKIGDIDYYNAKSDIKALDAKIESLNKNDYDLIFAIGTHTTKRLVRKSIDIPFIFTIVGSPENTGIVTNWKSSGKNYTGVETPNYYSKCVQLLHHYTNFKRLGMIYLAGSPSHEAGLTQLSDLSKSLGFELVTSGFALRDKNGKRFSREIIRTNIKQALDTVCPSVDVFFVQTSKAFTTHFDLFSDAFIKYHLPSAGDPINISNGLLVGIGKDAKKFGEKAAEYAIRIMQGESPSQLPMDTGNELNIQVNLKSARLVDYQVPFELLSAADRIIR